MKQMWKQWAAVTAVFMLAVVLTACGSKQAADTSGGAAATTTPDNATAANTQAPANREVSSTDIDWLPFDKGLQYAASENKLMLVDFSASWCVWCKKMEAETFTEPDVIRYINTHFIPVRVMSDSDNMLNINGKSVTEKQLAIQAGIRGLPTFAVFNKDLARVYQFSGYRDGSRFIAELEKVPATTNN